MSLTIKQSFAQASYKVLFLGNSYTDFNNLPLLVHNAALSAGDTLIHDKYTPGGYQLIDHSLDVNSQNKIMMGGWDYVVIQGQSQEPVTYSSDFFNGGFALYNLIKQYNPCAVTIPYMTWGRKNGDAATCPFFPIMCTYEGMDTTIRNQYLNLTEFINGEVSPVSMVWKYLRQNFPAIELYQPDESHPSAAGSYAAACSFYASIFKKDPTLITYDFGLPASDAANIRNAAKMVVFDNLQSYDYKKLPVSDFRYIIGTGNNEVIFNPVNQGVRQTYAWDFGDGTTDSISNPTHSYLTDGTYTVTLTTTTCDLQGLHTSTSDTIIQFCSQTPTIFTSNPWLCKVDTLWTQPAGSYQWYSNNVPLPETNQFIADYTQYNFMSFSVMSTLNGCSELSEIYSESAVWSGYYFDAMGDPCQGDTVAFAVLHTNGSLPGTETINWYKNDTLLSWAANEDTLLISSQGKYECKIVNPVSVCPLDTTSSMITYNCGTVGVANINSGHAWNLYPNPATEYIYLMNGNSMAENVNIYNAVGQLINIVLMSPRLHSLDVSELPAGLFYIRQSHSSHVLRFIKY